MKTAVEKIVYSKPTRCLKCSIVVEMTHLLGADPKSGGWECSNCGHLYRFTHYKISKGGTRTPKS